MTRFFRFIIKIYAYLVSPLLGNNCRYHPTCSAYADEALQRHGALKGFFLSLLRISRCHPWSKRPHIDPVPQRFTWGDILGYKRQAQKSGKKP